MITMKKTLFAALFLMVVANPIAGVRAMAEEEIQWADINNELSIDRLPEYEEIVIEEEPAVEFSGTLTSEETIQEHVFTAPRSGYYNFWIGNFTSNTSAWLKVYDGYDNEIVLTDDNRSAKLDEGMTYTLKVSDSYARNMNYTIKVFSQKPIIDISGNVIVTDQIVYSRQYNYYSYIPTTSGTHSLVIEPPSGTGFGMYVWDQNDELIYDDGNGYYSKGDSVVLNEGEEYTIGISTNVYTDEGRGKYTFYVGAKKPIVDVTGYTVIKDAFDYPRQRNTYNFTAPVDGVYQFTFDSKYPCKYGVYTSDGNETVLSYDEEMYSTDTQCELVGGTDYYINVIQVKGEEDYSLNITYPKEAESLLVSDDASTQESDTEAEMDPKYAALEEKNRQLESELTELQAKYDLLTQIIGDSGLEIDGE